ncbi:MAG TPA: NADH-quinone oxidoreductase subunit J [Anaeromyxobacteraceae bacterium]|nr:NADH-quinone oxidoreductase subunit J [Anaeromyxobacteraceae bacterium]
MGRKLVTWAVLAGLVVAFVGILAYEMRSGGPLATTLPDGPSGLRDLLFYAFAALTLGGACGVAFSRNIIYSAIGLLAALAGAGSLYIFLSADFLAVTQLLVYIGGVLVLILFAVMLTSRITDIQVSNVSLGVAGGAALLCATAPVLAFVALATPWATRATPEVGPTTRAIGNAFLTTWLLPFELASLVLLATLIGAIVIARKELKTDEPAPTR